MNTPKSTLCPSKEALPKQKRVRKQLCTKSCRRTPPAPIGVKRPRFERPASPHVEDFKSSKNRPPTPFNHLYCCLPAYCPVSPAYPPTSPPYVPTEPSYGSISSTTLSDLDSGFPDLPSLSTDEDFFGSSDESDN